MACSQHMGPIKGMKKCQGVSSKNLLRNPCKCTGNRIAAASDLDAGLNTSDPIRPEQHHTHSQRGAGGPALCVPLPALSWSQACR